MKIIFALSALCISTVSTAFTATELNSEKLDQVFELHGESTFKVEYFMHGLPPNIREFMHVRELVNTIIEDLVSNQYQPTNKLLEVGVTEKKMNGGNVVISEGKLYIAATAHKTEVQKNLLEFFEAPRVTYGKITYFGHLKPAPEIYQRGIQLVQSIVEKIEKAGFVLDSDELEIGISEYKMTGGNIVEHTDQVFVKYNASTDELERGLLTYYRWPD